MVQIKATLGAFFPVSGDGNTVTAILVASVGIWLFHFLILRGTQHAPFINQVVTIANILPILAFILILIFAFKYDLLSANFFGGKGYEGAGLFDQVRATMLVTVFVFLGIEGASVYSRFAQKRSHVGTATILSFLGVSCASSASTASRPTSTSRSSCRDGCSRAPSRSAGSRPSFCRAPSPRPEHRCRR